MVSIRTRAVAFFLEIETTFTRTHARTLIRHFVLENVTGE